MCERRQRPAHGALAGEGAGRPLAWLSRGTLRWRRIGASRSFLYHRVRASASED